MAAPSSPSPRPPSAPCHLVASRRRRGTPTASPSALVMLLILSAGHSAVAPAAVASAFQWQWHHPPRSRSVTTAASGRGESSFAVVGAGHVGGSKRRTSTTSLDLFGMNKKDDDDDAAAIKKKEEEEGGGGAETFLRKYLPAAKVAVPSFLAGTVVTLGLLFLPMLAEYYEAFNYGTYGPSESGALAKGGGGSGNAGGGGGVNQPVILFETILNDLNDAYVDDVDVQALFETGVKAMTASLDPYTEFESRNEAQELEESVSGRYGGVGLVIRGTTAPGGGANFDDDDGALDGVERITPGAEGGKETRNDKFLEKPTSSSSSSQPPQLIKDAGMKNKLDGGKLDKNRKALPANDGGEEDDDDAIELAERRRARKKSMEDGIRVVSAFEGYAYDAGFRVGDKLLAVDDFQITPGTAVDEVRNHLRGDPGTPVSITFLREGVGGKVNEPQTIQLERSVVRIPDVKYYGFIGDPKDRIGYIDLSGFSNDAGAEVRYAIRALQHGSAEMMTGDQAEPDGLLHYIKDTSQLKGLILDLRSNPGGLLTSAVDVATLFVPNGSDIVSAKGRGFPETLYRSKVDPIIDPSTKFAVLVNEQTASAAEIVSGAVQDLDVGVIVGKGRTFGKGLVQNVQDLPYQTALKYTVAKYYTPSGRCIQSTVYEEGKDGSAKYKSSKVADKDRSLFYTAHGREVKDGGGVEVDFKVEPPKASPLELILLNSGAYSDYAAEWSKNHELTDNFKVDDATYKDFIRFVEKREGDGDIKLEVLYDEQLKELQKKLKASKFDSSRRELAKLRADIIKDTKKDFTKYKNAIVEDLEQNILARYLPDSMLIERGLRSDVQVKKTAAMLKDGREFAKLLPRDANGLLVDKRDGSNADGSYETALTPKASNPAHLSTMVVDWPRDN